MQIPFQQIDAFTDQKFRGNPAVVCLLENNDDISDEIKQKIAAEVNQTTTAFVSPKWSSITTTDNSDDLKINHYKIQFFTPTQEWKICGHATFASTLALNKILKKLSKKDIINQNNEKLFSFETKFGENFMTKINEKEMITISLPILEIESVVSLDDKWAKNIVKITFGPKYDPSFVDEICLSQIFILIKLKDFNENYTTKLEPDFARLKYIDRFIIVTQKANFDKEKVHFYSRVFAPWFGINEDPVCGSAHAQLTPYWSNKLGIKGPIIGYQCSERGGIIQCVRNGDRIELTGNAVLVRSGSIFV